MSITYFLMPNGGGGLTPDGTIPTGAVICTQAQFQNASNFAIDATTTPPSIVAAPAPVLSLAAQAAAMLAAGIQIISTGTPSLNGTYAVDPATYQRITGIVAAIAGGLGLPGGGATFNWLDTSGAPHAFSSAAFNNFAKAVMDFEYTLNSVVGANAGTLPTVPVTIA